RRKEHKCSETRSASSPCLPQHHLDPLLKTSKASIDRFGQLNAAYVNVEHGCLQGRMTCIQSDLVQVHVGPRHMSQAKMTWGMGGEVWQTHTKSKLLDNLRPGDQSQGMRGIAMRL